MVWPVSEALVIDSCSPHNRGASLGKIVMSSNLGMVIGPFIGGALFFVASEWLGMSETDSFKFPFYFTGIVSLLGFGLVWIYVTDAKSRSPRGGSCPSGSCSSLTGWTDQESGT